ncbi:hypothetical protein TRIP_B40026 [uncultured Desulfatiglans sp.]|nr:hypothetical protein TRIP_B40026 [uncultured Desulfatiglans sp.]
MRTPFPPVRGEFPDVEERPRTGFRGRFERLQFDGLAGFEHDRFGGRFPLDPLGPLVGVLADHVEGVEMDGDDPLRLEQLHRPEGVVGPHGEVVSDRQDGQIDAFLADQFHVVEKTGIAGMVNLPALDGEEEAAGVAAVGAVRQNGAVVGDRQLDAPPWEVEPSADVHRVGVFDALGREPVLDLEIGDRRGMGAFRDRHGIAHMVAVAVRDQDEVRVQLVRCDGGCRVAGDERIDEQARVAGVYHEAGMSVPGHFDGHFQTS